MHLLKELRKKLKNQLSRRVKSLEDVLLWTALMNVKPIVFCGDFL